MKKIDWFLELCYNKVSPYVLNDMLFKRVQFENR